MNWRSVWPSARCAKRAGGKGRLMFLCSRLSPEPGGSSDAWSKRSGAASAAPDQKPTPTRFRV